MEDAFAVATHAAVEEGVVPDGRVALVRARRTIPNLEGANKDQTGIGIQL